MWDIPADELYNKDLRVSLWKVVIFVWNSHTITQIIVAIAIVYGPAMFFVKLSMLLLYLRIFAVNTTMKYLIYFGIAFQVLFYLATFAFYLAVEVLCVSTGSFGVRFCTESWQFVPIQGAINVATDFYVLCLPTAMIMQLHLSIQGKMKIIAIFMTGLL